MGRETLKDSISPREPAVNEKAAHPRNPTVALGTQETLIDPPTQYVIEHVKHRL